MNVDVLANAALQFPDASEGHFKTRGEGHKAPEAKLAIEVTPGPDGASKRGRRSDPAG